MSVRVVAPLDLNKWPVMSLEGSTALSQLMYHEHIGTSAELQSQSSGRCGKSWLRDLK